MRLCAYKSALYLWDSNTLKFEVNVMIRGWLHNFKTSKVCTSGFLYFTYIMWSTEEVFSPFKFGISSSPVLTILLKNISFNIGIEPSLLNFQARLRASRKHLFLWIFPPESNYLPRPRQIKWKLSFSSTPYLLHKPVGKHFGQGQFASVRCGLAH